MTLFSVTALLSTYNVGPITLRRPTWARLDDGVWSESTDATSITLDPVAVHPKRRGRTQNSERPDSDRTVDRVQVYATVELRQGDHLPWRGKTYRITDVDPCEEVAGGWKAQAELI